MLGPARFHVDRPQVQSNWLPILGLVNEHNTRPICAPRYRPLSAKPDIHIVKNVTHSEKNVVG